MAQGADKQAPDTAASRPVEGSPRAIRVLRGRTETIR